MPWCCGLLKIKFNSSALYIIDTNNIISIAIVILLIKLITIIIIVPLCAYINQSMYSALTRNVSHYFTIHSIAASSARPLILSFASIYSASPSSGRSFASSCPGRTPALIRRDALRWGSNRRRVLLVQPLLSFAATTSPSKF